ncbi:uncharacterized protein EAE97_005847 [Botrytis byssoidea]|uniref:Uncharacterized protein n=1 Tax=Botrytis byssoidea TaxID=139641 RepID=A0A9P5LUU3_9HELO|nr:uncharacterized protein EAE97_005847 [Botrytis byssoidea]KAF7943777.1 hypothetical protein EAE97_005847 [Botrytis byssoidea]
MPPRPCWRPQIPRTELADIYGHLAEPELQGIIPLKSGLTPVTLKPHSTNHERKFADDVRWLQRLYYGNFTVAELERLDALAPLYHIYEDETAINPNTDITIHPVMQRKKWDYPLPNHLADFPLGGDLDGYWNAGTDDTAWEAVLPSIRIASLYISHADLWPWFDGLLAAEWTDIPPSEVPFSLMTPRSGWKRFNARDPLVCGTEAGRRKVRDTILSHSKNIYFRLTSSYTDPANGVLAVDHKLGSIAGQTLTSAISNISVVTISFHALAALLPGTVEKLNTAERRMVQGEVAKTIIHELGHALFQQTYKAYLPNHNGTEIYFHKEVISEMGISVYGGTTRSLRSAQDDSLLDLVDMGSKSRFEYFVRKYGTETVKYKKVTGTKTDLKEDGTRFADTRDPFTEFEGIPNNNQHTMLRSETMDTSEPPRKRGRVPTAPAAVVRKARTFRGPRRTQERNPQMESLSEFLDPDLPPCPRFDEISRYLINNRRELALHTMCFAMPENTLRDYILRLGGLEISAKEWRAYLLHCEAVPYLFRFQPHGRIRDISTYRGSIQLHASSWPKTDLPRFKAIDTGDATFMKNLLKGMRLCIAMDALSKKYEQFLDQIWLHSVFWDVDIETFLTLFNADVKQGDGVASMVGLGLMTKKEVEDLIQVLASIRLVLTWAPKGIIRRLPLTTTECKELTSGGTSLRDIILPKGRSLIDWDAGYEALCEWDDDDMVTDLEALDEGDTGITYADGRHESAKEYAMRTEPPPVKTQAQLESEEYERQISALDNSILAYLAAHPEASDEEIFEKSFWELWKGFYPNGVREDALEEFADSLPHVRAVGKGGEGVGGQGQGVNLESVVKALMKGGEGGGGGGGGGGGDCPTM